MEMRISRAWWQTRPHLSCTGHPQCHKFALERAIIGEVLVNNYPSRLLWPTQYNYISDGYSATWGCCYAPKTNANDMNHNVCLTYDKNGPHSRIQIWNEISKFIVKIGCLLITFRCKNIPSNLLTLRCMYVFGLQVTHFE